MRVKSFAKINLGLEVLGKREDGYHQIKTLFQTIDFFDILKFNLLPEGEIRLKGDDLSISWDENNLIYKAASLLKQKGGEKKGVEIQVEKNIPPGKGLGGGSSNAAVTLWALNKLWSLSLPQDVLLSLSSFLGADVAYFLEGGLCLGEERGEKITPLADLDKYYCFLVLPPFSISTQALYSKVAATLTSKGKHSKIDRFIKNGELDSLENDLEKTIFKYYPQLKTIKDELKEKGSLLSLVSGSGGAVFGLFTHIHNTNRVFQEWRKEYQVVVVETLGRERYWNRLSSGV